MKVLARGVTASRTRSISVTTWRPAPARRRTSRSRAPSRSGSTSRSVVTPARRRLRRTPRRRSAYCPSLRACAARVSVTSSSDRARPVPAAPAPRGARRGRRARARCRRCGSRGAGVVAPAQQEAADWSMPPVGAPATSFSARRRRRPAGRGRLVDEQARGRRGRSTAAPTAHSRAAELDSPAPTGTSQSMVTSSPRTSARLAQGPQDPGDVGRPATGRPGRPSSSVTSTSRRSGPSGRAGGGRRAASTRHTCAGARRSGGTRPAL